jgi:hypothetical protein
MDVQPRNLEVLDLEAADHRSSDRQPADRQGADGPGANSRRPNRGCADADRCQEHRRRLLAAVTRELHPTVGASWAVHAVVLLLGSWCVAVLPRFVFSSSPFGAGRALSAWRL